jgi:putative aminopeptidase FrvX
LLIGSEEALQSGTISKVGNVSKNGNGSSVVVTAHMDELGLMVSGILRNGNLKVVPLGGVYPWKWGEQPVTILARDGAIPGIISFGSIHTNSRAAVAEQARRDALTWDQASIFTGRNPQELVEAGVRPGTRIALAPERRGVFEIGSHVATHFIDDRADIVAMLLALEMIGPANMTNNVLFAATVAEEVGGEGALWLLNQRMPEICVALEIGPTVPESPFEIDRHPTVWVKDDYSTTSPRDLDILEGIASELGLALHFQALSRGGSDASCAAAQGKVARPVTLGLPVENSHGLEIMHRRAPEELARLLVAYLERVLPSATPV